MNATPREIRSDTAEAAATALAQSLAQRLAAAIEARGTALFAVSGGRSPAPVFDALSRIPIAWARVIVTQVDERWVEPDHPDSNALLIRRHLLTGPAEAAHFVPMKNQAPDPYAGEAQCEALLQALPRPFDIVMLGMGEDGHTASLFPGAAELGRGLSTDALCLAVTPPAAPFPRLSLSLKGLLDSRLIILQLGGPAKETVYRRSLDAGPVDLMPIRAILRQERVPVEVWLHP